MQKSLWITWICLLIGLPLTTARADEHLLGYVRGAETLPEGAWEFYQFITFRDNKGRGSYHAVDTITEVEYGFTNRFNLSLAAQMLALNTNGLVVNGYLPKDNRFDLRPAGFELSAKYNFLAPALDPIGLSALWSFHNMWIDPHSGQRKDTYSFESLLLLQKYFFDAQLTWTANIGIEATYAHRKAIDDLPAGFEWATEPEMEIETKLGTGLSYRFVANWFLGAEGLYEVEYETEVGRERFTLFAGPSLHYASQKWWATLTWFPQIDGGGEQYDDQSIRNMHLIEKTKTETRIKVGFIF